MSQLPEMEKPGWTVAVDGGGSKIAVAAAPESLCAPPLSNETISPSEHGSTAPRLWHFDGTGSAHPVTWPQATDNLCRALEQVVTDLRHAGISIAIVKLALAGAGRADDQDRVIKTLKTRCPWLSDIALHCMGDIEPLVDYRAADMRSLAVILGTGSVVASRGEADQLVRAGGWGPLLGDACSGGAIGLSALRYLSQLIDEGQTTEQFSALAQALVSETQTMPTNTPSTLSSLLIQIASDRTLTARLAGVVLRCAYDKQDRDAFEMLEPHLADIVWQIRQVARRAGINDQALQINFTGGIAEHHPELRQAIRQACVAAGLHVVAVQLVEPLQAILRCKVNQPLHTP